MKFRLIDASKADLRVERMCDLLDVSISGYDNAIVETVFKTIKNKRIWRASFQTRQQATIQLGKYIDGFYNPRRRHSALGYKSSNKFEAEMAIIE